MSISFQRIVLIVLILVFFGLILSVYSQYRIAWENLNVNLQESLTLEGEELAEWITRSFLASFELDVWRDSPDPELTELTGSQWALVDQEGGLVSEASGNSFYEYPDTAVSKITSVEAVPDYTIRAPRTASGLK